MVDKRSTSSPGLLPNQAGKVNTTYGSMSNKKKMMAMENLVDTMLIKNSVDMMSSEARAQYTDEQPLSATIKPFAIQPVIREASVTAYTNGEDGVKKKMYDPAKDGRQSEQQMLRQQSTLHGLSEKSINGERREKMSDIKSSNADLSDVGMVNFGNLPKIKTARKVSKKMKIVSRQENKMT